MSSRKPPSQRDPGSSLTRVNRTLQSMVPGTMKGRVANASPVAGSVTTSGFGGGAGGGGGGPFGGVTGDPITTTSTGAVLFRQIATYATTTTTSAGYQEQGTISMAADYRVLYIQTSAPARVRLYASISDRERDIGRPLTYDPFPGLGIVMDWLTSSALLAAPLSPVAEGALFTTDSEGHIISDVPITVTSIDGGNITVSLTYTALE